MSCKDSWEKEMAGRLQNASRIAAGQVDGGQRCTRPGCDALVNRATGLCVKGHRQDVTAAGYPRELDALLCVAEELQAQGRLSEEDEGTVAVVQDFRSMAQDGDAGTGDDVAEQGSASVLDLLNLVERMEHELDPAASAALHDDARTRAGRDFLQAAVLAELKRALGEGREPPAAELPRDQHGHLVDAAGKPVTDPYGHLTWCLGTSDDFVCLDYHVDPEHDVVVLHAAVNSETGGFVDDFSYIEVPRAEAAETAQGLVDQAMQWAWDNELRRPALKEPARRFLASLRRELRTVQPAAPARATQPAGEVPPAASGIIHRDWNPTGDSMEDLLAEGGGTLPYDRAGYPVIYLTADGTELCASCAMDDLRLPPGEDQGVQGYRLLDEPGLTSECAECGYEFAYEGEEDEE